MLTNKLVKIRNFAFYLKRVMESNYVPLLENNLSYVTNIYNYLSNILSKGQSLDVDKVEVFYNKSLKDLNEINYNLKRLGYQQVA